MFDYSVSQRGLDSGEESWCFTNRYNQRQWGGGKGTGLGVSRPVSARPGFVTTEPSDLGQVTACLLASFLFNKMPGEGKI